MAATAAARRVQASPSRRATANRPALQPRPRRVQPAKRTARTAPRRAASRARRAQPRRRQVTPIGGFVPVAVGATAGAIGGLADSGLVVRLTRGRLWIGALGTLLVGIVALNVVALSLNSSSSKVAQQTDGLKRANSALRARIAGEQSNEQVQAAADKLGLFYPPPNAVSQLRPDQGDAAEAARRLTQGEITAGTETAPVATTTTTTDPTTAAIDPATGLPITDEAATAIDPATGLPTATSTPP
jgi:hypothetical protein